MRKCLFLIPFFAIYCHCYASQIDTTIFNSGYEKQLFLHQLNDTSVKNINWLLAIDYENTFKSFIIRYQKFVNTLQKETNTYPSKKKLKILIKNVQDAFLKNYQDVCFFSDLFTSGTYNCVTASAIYSMVLDELKIPYQIRQKGQEVYVIANPDESPTLIRTYPINRITQYNNKMMSNFVEFLHDQKIIFDQEFKSETAETLFAKYFIAEKKVSIKQLAGVLYYNKGIILYDKTDHEDALRNFEKAELLYPSYLILYMKSIAAINVLNEDHQKKLFRGKSLAKYLLSSGVNPKTMNNAKNFFSEVTNELVMNHPNIQLYDQYFNELRQYLDSISIKEFAQTYFFFKSYYLYYKNDHTNALSFLVKAYQINPDNIQTQQLAKELTYRILENITNNINSFESFQKMFQWFPFLKDERNLQKIYLYTCARAVTEAYQERDYNMGNGILAIMEAELIKSNINEFEQEPIEFVYNQIATYYYGIGNYSQALKALARGIGLLPKSEILKKRYQSIVDYKFAGRDPANKNNSN